MGRPKPGSARPATVHLIHSELYAELRGAGFNVSHGQMGENITTGGVDLLGLLTGALLRIRDAVVEITGLRNPCAQLNKIQPGLLDSVLGHDEDGNLIRKAGIMGIVVTGGEVATGAEILVELPSGPHEPLLPV